MKQNSLLLQLENVWKIYQMGEVGMLRGGTFVSIDSMIIAISVSVIIGIIAGFVPAYQASRLKPVDALRYE